ncbi:carbohydrate-binding module family 1 protein [Xylariaceae sp. FL0255]|nr:carbohydrate-binding module family 1 protein [Xylariaceae sp. FL0255]
MRSSLYSAAALALGAGVNNVAAHATFQDLWVNGVDNGGVCARLPLSNSPVTDVNSTDLACNAGTSPVASTCTAPAGGIVTVEMHQQPGDRSCAEDAIGGDHYGPVMAYMAAVSDATTAVGADAAWFKVFADTWAKNASGSIGSDDDWGTKDLNNCCGLMDVLIPADIEPGDYLLRAEVIALHVASSVGGAQFYMTCYQITVTGGGDADPATVSIPGAYNEDDPGILINIYEPMTTYVEPGPTVFSAGSTKSAGSPCEGCESTCNPDAATTTAVGSTTTPSAPKTTTPAATTTTAKVSTTGTTKTASTPTSSPTGSCSVAAYGQCGGTGFSGCTTCASGNTCSDLNDYYSQCVPA